MKKAKILTVLGVMLALGMTACNKPAQESKDDSKEPGTSQVAPSSQGGGTTSQGGGNSSQQGGGSSVDPGPQKDATGHIWGADADIAGDAENGLAGYKRAECTEGDKAVKYTVNQSVVTYVKGQRKDGTPEGYTKLKSDGDIMSFKFNTDKYLKGKLYFFGRMDGYSTESNQNAGFWRNNTPSIEVKINNEVVDLTSQKGKTYADYFGTNVNSTDMASPSNYLSDEGYAPVGDIVLVKGVNEFTYQRVQTQNMIIKDFVFVGEEFDSEWGEGQNVAAADGGMAYIKYQSNIDDKVMIEWKAVDGTLSDGAAIKAGTPEGFLKLNDNTQKMSYVLNVDANLDDQLYQRGAMDGYPGNASCTYFSQTKGAKYGNFEMKVNDSIVYIGDKRNVTYGDMLGTKAAEGDDAIGTGYSPVGDCLIGDCFLKNGVNTASYERVDSYNFAISHFVFIGKPGKAHTNPAADAAFAGQDNDSHWQVSEGDEFKFNRGEHRLVADPDETDTTSTCTVKGVKHYKCEICGKKVTEELPLVAHTWVSDPDLADTDVASTCTAHGVAHMKCSVCGAKEAQELPLGNHAWVIGEADANGISAIECSDCHTSGVQFDGFTGDNSGNISSGKINKKVTFNWAVDMPKAGKVSLQLNVAYSTGNGGQKFDQGYTLKCGENDGVITIGNVAYNSILGPTAEAKSFVEFGQVDVPKGESTITFYYANNNYRLLTDKLVRLVYLA